MTNCGFGNWTAPHPLLKQEKKMKKIKLATTIFRDKTLFKPTASASPGSGGPRNEHRQKAKSCVLQIPPPAERKKVLEGSEGVAFSLNVSIYAMPTLDMSR